MTAANWALLIGLLANALAIWWGMRRIGKDVHKIELETNSMRTALEAAKKAEGKLEEKEEAAARSQK